MKLESKFDLGSYVHIDSDHSSKGVVTAIIWRAMYGVPVYEVSWIANGVPQSPAIEELRLIAA